MGEQIFTEHVRLLLVGQPDDGRRVRAHLKSVISIELNRLGQWSLPPRFLGYTGESWPESDALDDLVHDAYLACIVKRMKKLAEFLQASGSIEGAVHWKLQRFLLDRQRHSDPARTRIFNNVKAASAALIAQGQAEAVAHSPLTSGTVVLALGKAHPCSRERLADLLAFALGDVAFLAATSRECVASRKLIENALLASFENGVTGYQLGHVIELLVQANLAVQGVAELAAQGHVEIARSAHLLLDLIPDFRVLAPAGRCQQSEDLSLLMKTFIQHVQSTVRNPRIQSRIIRLLEYLAALIRSGEDVTSLTQAETARRLGVSYATLIDDLMRLRTTPVLHLVTKGATQ